MDGPLPVAGDTRLYAIVGDPIAQVTSPILFNAAFRRLGMRAVLVPIHVEATSLPAALGGLRTFRNLDGIIITVPHKMAVVPHVDRVGRAGQRIGAVNAIRCEAGGIWHGDNFDGAGCVRGLRDSGHSLEGRSALIVGAGGAGSAVAFALADAGVGRIAVHDTAAPRTERLVNRLREYYPGIAAGSAGPDPRGFSLVVNCTSLGMGLDDPLPVDPGRLDDGALVVDVILKPEVSPLLVAARARGLATQTGRRMLEGQVGAILQFFGTGGPR